MAHQDPISDLLTRLRNATAARHRFVDFNMSSQKLAILKVLEQQGYVEHILVNEEQRKVRVFLRYAGGREPILQGLKRVSKPGMRRYIQKTDIPTIAGGLGTAVLSTSQGVVDGETARQRGVGGELLCYVW